MNFKRFQFSILNKLKLQCISFAILIPTAFGITSQKGEFIFSQKYAPPKSFFEHVYLEYDSISKYYEDSNFGKIIFQQVTQNSENNRKHFILIAYIIDKEGVIVNKDAPIVLKITPGIEAIPGPKKINFANLPLIKDSLKKLYTEGNDTLFFTPKIYEVGGVVKDYMRYEITNSKVHKKIISYLDPSPPAKP